MTLTRNLLSDAVRYGLAAGAVGLLGLAANPAHAQATTTTAKPDDQKAKNLERIDVIGSRIKRAVDYESSAPVTTLTRADIEQTGLTTTYDLINHISASDGSGLSTVTTQTNGSDGSQYISLRNLGSNRTLVLVDGKRWPGDGFGNVDLASIPVAIIERIDVLKDGASAIYGSDAIAGVIDIITRKKYDGAQVGWYYGQTSHGDGVQDAVDATIGATGERSSGVISISRSEQKPIFAGDRSISDASAYGCDQLLSNWPTSDPIHKAGKCGSTFTAFGRFFGAGLPGNGATLDNSFHDSHNASGNPSSATVTAPGGGRFASDFVTFNPLDRYNFAPVNYLQQPAVRNNIYGSGRFSITDNVEAYARVSYTQRQSSQQLAQVPTSLSSSGGFGPQWTFGVAPNNVFNPFGTQITGTFFRNVAVGPRHNNYDFNTLGSIAGLKGQFELGSRNFNWEVYAQYNSARSTKIGLNYINLFNLKNALGPSFRDAGGLHCGTVGNVLAGCVPFNVFGGPDLGLSHGIISAAEYAAMVNYISYTEVQANGDRGINYGADFSGEIVPLQGGMLSFAAGIETRRERYFNQPDALVSGGGSSDNFVQPTQGQTKVDEAYLELDAPILKDLPFAKLLEFDAAVRKSRYHANGLIGTTAVSTDPGNPTNYKFSLQWKPVTDLLVRASYGDTFRAPSVGDLFAGGTENFPAANDPCNDTSIGNLPAAGQALCHAQGVPAGGIVQLNGQIRALQGGNPYLKPEHGKNFSAGFVFSPGFISGLNLTVDYWRINLKDAIVLKGIQTFLDGCYVNPDTIGTPDFCSGTARLPNGQISVVQTGQLNAAGLFTDGIDFGLTYKRDIGNFGNFGVKWDTTYVRHNRITNSDGTSADFVGEYNGAPNWKYRSIATIDWTKGDWDAAWTLRYVSKQDENCNRVGHLICNHPNDVSSVKDVRDNSLTPMGFNRMGATTYNDVQIGWKAPWKGHLAVGARNVFGKEPPISAYAFASSFDASYDLPGGPFYYFKYRQDF